MECHCKPEQYTQYCTCRWYECKYKNGIVKRDIKDLHLVRLKEM